MTRCLLCEMVKKCEGSVDDGLAAGFVLGGLSEKFDSFKELFNSVTCDQHAELISEHFAAAAVNFAALLKET